jgi:extracellular factor (EF) 3-hydroxypalmitic acid methyl ester biosynthesis protein
MNRVNGVSRYAEYILALIASGGPSPGDYATLTSCVNSMATDIVSGAMTAREAEIFWRDLTTQYFQGTAQAHALLTPHGYHGDYEIIDIIYQQRVATDLHLEKWDRYFHAQAAPKAVRNRKDFFHALLNEVVERRSGQPIQVLNVASAPGRDMREWFDTHPEAPIFFNCVELDLNAIEYARDLCAPFLDKIQFHQANALRFHTSKKYDLVWSGGLFDYLSESLFVRLVRRLLRFARSGGELAFGNFGDFNPTRNYMELLGEWKLNHRSREQLLELAESAGLVRGVVRIEHEPEGVNLFLRISLP